MSVSSFTSVLDYPCNVFELFFGEGIVAFAMHIFNFCLSGFQLLNEVFNGTLTEIIIGGVGWLIFLAVMKRKPSVGKGKPYSGKMAYDGKANTSKANNEAVPEHSVFRSQLQRNVDDGHEVQQLVACLLASGRGARQAPGSTLEKYDRLVRLRGVDLRQHLEGGKQANSFYLALAVCGKGRGCSSCEKAGTTWIQRLLVDMRRFRFPRSLEFYTSLAKICANEQVSKDIIDIYQEMAFDDIAPDSGLLICFMNAAKARGESDQAIWYFDMLTKLGPPTMRSYMTVLSIYKSRRDCCGAIRLLEDMEAQETEPDTLILNHVLSLCVESGRVPDGERLLNQWQNISDVISVNTILKGYSHQAALSKAETLLQSMLTNGPAPNIVTFNTIMDCSVRSINLQKTDRSPASTEAAKRPWDLLDQLSALGIEPDRYTCSIVVKGMHYSAASSADIDRAIVLLKRVGPNVLQASDWGNANDRKNNLRLVEVLFNTLLDICASCRDLERMVDIFALMKEFKVNITNVTFGILIKAYGQAGHLPRCHEVWTGMLCAGVMPTVVTFGCYIDACIKNSDIASAERIYSSMVSSNVRPNAVIYTSLIRGLAASGEPAKAFKLYRQMRQNGVEPTAVTFNSVLDMVARQMSDPEVLESIFKDMRDVDSAPDAAVLAMLIKASCNAGNIDSAMTFFRQVQEKGLIYDHAAMNSLLLACAKSDRVGKVEDVLAYMRQRGNVPNHMANSAIASMYGRAGMPEKAASTQRR